MLLAGINHIGMLTSDTDRLVAFYSDVFGATVDGVVEEPGELKLTLVKVGEYAELNVFEIPGNREAEKQVPMFERGRLDHFGFQAASLEAFDTIRDRLVERGATDGFVTDFGQVLSLFFRDPEGLEAEVCVGNPDAVPGQLNPPGTPSRRYHPAG